MSLSFALTDGWLADVERGPDWLFIRLRAADANCACSHLAEALGQLADQEFVSRIVLELDECPPLTASMAAELARFHAHMAARGGMLRLCGLGIDCERLLATMSLEDRLPSYATRHAAVMGHRPTKPR